MKALIIGGAGFVGKHLYTHLKEQCGMDVAVTKMPNETFFDGGAEVHDVDILHPQAVSDLLEAVQPQVIYHLAALSSVALSWQQPALTADINIKGALHVLEAVRALKPPCRLILIGSGEEYGFVRPEEVPVGEENPLRPGNLYAMTKAAQTMAGQIYARAYGMDVVMVRAFNHIGPGQAPIFVVSDFCQQVAQMEKGEKAPVLRVGNLEAQRDFSDVRDVVRAYGLLATKGKAGEVYNVGRGEAFSIQSILELILRSSSIAIEVQVDQNRIRPSDVPILLADINKLSADTGYAPRISLKTSIEDTLNYWRETV